MTLTKAGKIWSLAWCLTNMTLAQKELLVYVLRLHWMFLYTHSVLFASGSRGGFLIVSNVQRCHTNSEPSLRGAVPRGRITEAQ